MDERKKIDLIVQASAYDLADAVFGAGHPGFKGFFLELKASMLDTMGKALIWKNATQWLDKTKEDKWIKKALDSPLPTEMDMNVPPEPKLEDSASVMKSAWDSASESSKLKAYEKYYKHEGDPGKFAQLLADTKDKDSYLSLLKSPGAKPESPAPDLPPVPEAKPDIPEPTDSPFNDLTGESPIPEPAPAPGKKPEEGGGTRKEHAIPKKGEGDDIFDPNDPRR